MRIISRSLAEAERLVADERAGLKNDFDLWQTSTRERVKSGLASPRTLGVAAAVAGLLLFRLTRPRRASKPVVAPETKKKGAAALLGGLALSALRYRYGSPWAAIPAWVGWARQPGRRIVARSRQGPWQQSRPW